MTDIERIAAGLSGPQKRWLGQWAKFCSPAAGHEKRWMTFPPSSTLRCLVATGLTDKCGQITPLGLAVRAHLIAQEKGDE